MVRLLWNYSGFSYSASNKGVGYVTEGDAIHAYEGLSGNIVWNYLANETVGSLELSNDILFVGSNGTLTALNADNGAKLWNYSLPGILRFNFGKYYGVDEHAAYLLFSKGTLFCYSGKALRSIDAYSGETLWNYSDYDRSFLTLTDNLAFYKTAHTIYAFSIPDIAFSPAHSSTAPPEQSATSVGLAVLGVASAIAIVAVALISLVYFKKHKPNTELDKKL